MGSRTIAGTLKYRRGPPALRLYAVDPVEVDRIRASDDEVKWN